mmetsp:Transcript_41585/g.123455  ORF Transcript_41585/g.123455 Transcript_41585/m.123455 type:complete len:145 (+) Transcript_41585:2-436(+)
MDKQADEVPTGPRAKEALAIRQKYPDRVPVICERAARSQLPEIGKKKFLVPDSMVMGEFKYVVHKHLHQATSEQGLIGADQTIYLFVKGFSPRSSSRMCEVYAEHGDADGFLNVTYSAENTLGTGALASLRRWPCAKGVGHDED